MRRLCRFSLPRDGFELLDLVLMLHAAHKALAVDRVAAVAGKAFAPILRAAFELCGKVRLADERVQIERRLLPRTAVEVDAADLRSVHAAKANYSTRRSSSSRVKSSGGLRRRAVHAPDALDAAVAELEEKFTAVPVHAVAGAAEKGLVRRLVQHGLARVGTLHLVDAEMAGDDKAHFVFHKLDERIRPERRHLTLFVRQMPVRRRADDAVFKLARAELCRGKQKAIIVSPYKIRSAMNIISGIVTGSSRFDCSTLLLAISGERS